MNIAESWKWNEIEHHNDSDPHIKSMQLIGGGGVTWTSSLLTRILLAVAVAASTFFWLPHFHSVPTSKGENMKGFRSWMFAFTCACVCKNKKLQNGSAINAEHIVFMDDIHKLTYLFKRKQNSHPERTEVYY